MKEIKAFIRPHMLDAVMDLIVEHGRTGRPGDGRLFISSVEESVRVRDGARERSG